MPITTAQRQALVRATRKAEKATAAAARLADAAARAMWGHGLDEQAKQAHRAGIACTQVSAILARVRGAVESGGQLGLFR